MYNYFLLFFMSFCVAWLEVSQEGKKLGRTKEYSVLYILPWIYGLDFSLAKCVSTQIKMRKAHLVFRGLFLPHRRKLKAAAVVDYDHDADTDSSELCCSEV